LLVRVIIRGARFLSKIQNGIFMTTTSMSLEQIQKVIPHRKPMLLVDEVVEQTDKIIVCRKTFSSDEFFLQGHFPNFPLVPGVILCECCLQSGAILLSQFTPQDGSVVPVATRLDGVKFKKMVRPGDTVTIEVSLNDVVSSAYFMTGKVTVDGKLAARLDFACSVAAPS
jgi:3-hydroxyacyl-[acyl-carrier-protein] dehydratase